jgi:hypothetical protein
VQLARAPQGLRIQARAGCLPSIALRIQTSDKKLLDHIIDAVGQQEPI